MVRTRNTNGNSTGLTNDVANEVAIGGAPLHGHSPDQPLHVVFGTVWVLYFPEVEQNEYWKTEEVLKKYFFVYSTLTRVLIVLFRVEADMSRKGFDPAQTVIITSTSPTAESSSTDSSPTTITPARHRSTSHQYIHTRAVITPTSTSRRASITQTEMQTISSPLGHTALHPLTSTAQLTFSTSVTSGTTTSYSVPIIPIPAITTVLDMLAMKNNSPTSILHPNLEAVSDLVT